MTRIAPPFVGTATADAYLIAVSVIGDREARNRVRSLWNAGTRLFAVDDDWLMVLPEPQSARCELAPGTPLSVHDESVRVWRAGEDAVLPLGQMTTIDPGQWIDVDTLDFEVLDEVRTSSVAVGAIELPEITPEVDVRTRAGVGARSEKAQSAAEGLAKQARTRTHGVGARAPTEEGPSGKGWIAKLLLRTPVRGVVSRRHAKYIESLTRQFENKQFDDALRNAVGLGESEGFASLRLPKRRSTLAPSTTRPVRGPMVPYGEDINSHLRRVYRQAATDLERAGRFEEAVFVYSDLLVDIDSAVGLLERNGRYELAAQISEANARPAAEAVRLWWLAGDRERAIAVARARGAFSAAIQRLASTDPGQAHELRREWITQLRDYGDYLAAVEVAWPDPVLRLESEVDIATGITMGGPTAGRLFAFQLALSAPIEAVETAVALIANTDPLRLGAQYSFIGALAEIELVDRVADRRLTSDAARHLVLPHTGSQWDSGTYRSVLNALRKRCDPLLREDIPSAGLLRTKATSKVLEIQGPAAEGEVPILDAIALPGHSVLTAHGNQGVRLLTLDGRTRAQWDIPTTDLIIADHGASALLARKLGNQRWEFHSLDLVRRQVKPWTTLTAELLAQSFDGSVLTIVDSDGVLGLVDVKSPKPRYLWREFSDYGGAIALTRGNAQMSALAWQQPFHGAGEPWIERFTWDIPSMTLRQRIRPLASGDREAMGLLANGQLGLIGPCLDPEEATPMRGLEWTEGTRNLHREQLPSEGFAALLIDGNVYGVSTTDASGVCLVRVGVNPGAALAQIRFDDASRVRLRSTGDLITVSQADGRVVVFNATPGTAVGNFRTRA